MRRIGFLATMMIATLLWGQNVMLNDKSIVPIENFNVNITKYQKATDFLGLVGSKLFALPLNKNYSYNIGYGYLDIKYLTPTKYKGLNKVYKPGEYRPIKYSDYEQMLANRYLKVKAVKFGSELRELSLEEWNKEREHREFAGNVRIYVVDESSNNEFIIERLEYFVAENYINNLKQKYIGKSFLYGYEIPKKRDYYDLYKPKNIDKNDIVKVVAIDIEMSISEPNIIMVFDNSKRVELGSVEHNTNYTLLEDYQNYCNSYNEYIAQRKEKEEIEKKQREEIYEKERLQREKQSEKERVEKYARLKAKYGKSIADSMIDGYVRIGWTKQMCIESWGEPDDINKTITRYSVSEQWVYGTGSYLYFENGKLTAIQN